MSFVAVAIGGAAVVSGVLGSRSADRAADAQQQSSDAAVNEQRRQFDLLYGDTAPYRQAGSNALADISREFGYPVNTAPVNALTNPVAPAPTGPIRYGSFGELIAAARNPPTGGPTSGSFATPQVSMPLPGYGGTGMET